MLGISIGNSLGASPSPGPLPPELTLDSDDSSGAGSGGFAATFTEGGAAVAIADVDTIITDPSADGIDTLVVTGSGIVDGADEVITIGADTFPTNADKSTTEVVGATTFAIAYVASTKKWTITKDGGGPAPKADLESLIEAMTYENTSGSPTTGDRTFTFVLTDDSQNSNSAVSTITVQLAAPNLTAPNTQYVARSQTISTISTANAGGDGTWSVAVPLPAGLTLNTSTGDITGIVDAGVTPGIFPIDLTCTNGAGSDAVTFDIDVRASFTTISSGDTFPYYLDTIDELYVLTEDISADGTAFVVIASGVVLDLGGHTATWDAYTPVTIANSSFEAGTGATADNWDFTNAPNGERFNGAFLSNQVYDGDYSVRFSDSTATEYIESVGTITLEPDTRYVLSAMMLYGAFEQANPGVKMYVQLVGTGAEPTIEASMSGTNWRGIQLVEQQFDTPAGTPTYNVRVGIVGHVSGTLPVYIDDVKVVKTKVLGVVWPRTIGLADTLGDVDQGGYSTGTVVTNGSLVQSGNAAWADGCLPMNVDDVTIRGVTIVTQGQNSSCIKGHDITTRQMTVTHNTLTSNCTTITSRDNYDGAVIKSINGTITDNTITNGCHGGYFSSSGAVSEVARNTIALKARYTNAFAIIASPASEVHHNTVNSHEGEYTSRGIGVVSGVDGANLSLVHHNIIRVQQLSNNQEYGGSPIGGAYGIQMEGVSYTRVYDNEVYAYATEAEAWAFRPGPYNSGPGVDNEVYGNTFSALKLAATAGLRCGAVNAQGVDADVIDCHDNTVITNDVVIQATTSEMTLEACHLEVTTAVGAAYPIIGQFASGTGVHSTITFIDTTFEDTASETYLRDATPANYSSLLADARIAYEMGYTQTITITSDGVTPSSGVAWSVVDVADTAIDSGTTDGTGIVSVVCKEFIKTGTTNDSYNQHELTTDVPSTHRWDADDIQSLTFDTSVTVPVISDLTTQDVTIGDTGVAIYVNNTGGDGTLSVVTGSLPPSLSAAYSAANDRIEITGDISSDEGDVGSYSVTYRLTNASGYDDAVVPIDVASNVTAPTQSDTATTYIETTNLNPTAALPDVGSEGDLLIAMLAWTGRNFDSAPVGWNELFVTADGQTEGLAVFWKVRGASEPATHDFSLNSGTDMAGAIIPWAGAGDPSLVTPVGATWLGSAAVSMTSITTTSNESVILAIAMDRATRSFTWASSTEIIDFNADLIQLAAAWKVQSAAGASGTENLQPSGYCAGRYLRIVIPPA